MAAVEERTGLDVDRRQINRLRQSTSPDVFNLVLTKLQVLPAMLNQIRCQLPEVEAILHTSEISPQLTTAANHAFAMLQKNIRSSSNVLDKEAEKSIQSLFLARKMSSVIWRSPLATRCIQPTLATWIRMGRRLQLYRLNHYTASRKWENFHPSSLPHCTGRVH